jgi:hypothetical protein
MKQKEIVVRAFLKEIKNGYITFLFFANELEPFTKKFITEYYKGQNSTVTDNGFKVKYISNSKAFRDKAGLTQISIYDLINQGVEAKLLLKHFNFNANGKRIMGWNLTLICMNPI